MITSKYESRFFHSAPLGEVCHGRDNNFNLMRVGAALAVIVSHSCILRGNEANQIPRILSFFAVNCFFVISGFLVCKSLLYRPNLLAFLWARFLRIYPALVIAVAFCVFIISPLHTRLSLGESFSSGLTWRFEGVQYSVPRTTRNSRTE